ncbi:MAG: polymerase sigma70 factor [Ferruginibacter sp.]|nr:polymerase sigma70 factor [Ferruginibacter sp.]
MAFLKKISSDATDAELVQEYKSGGDLEILADLYQRYMDLLYGVCLKYLQTPEDAQDAVINIYQELILKLKKYEVEYFRAWVYQLAKNHCLMLLRSRKKMPVNVDIDLVQSAENMHPEEAWQKEANFQQLQLCLEQLGTEQKQAIELFYLQEKCYKDISELTGIESGKVRSYIQNGRRNLKNCMEKQALENVQ